MTNKHEIMNTYFMLLSKMPVVTDLSDVCFMESYKFKKSQRERATILQQIAWDTKKKKSQ